MEAKAPVTVVFRAGTHAEQSVALPAGELLTIKAKDSLTLSLNNAAGASVIVNGLDRGRLGAEGQAYQLRLPEQRSN